jgi:uncharacterized protein YmfQ (DUF2313 family)
MARTPEQFLDQMLQLPPPGIAVTRRLDSNFAAFMLAFSDSLARLDQRVDDLMNEIDPRTTLELLPEWERFAKLPDPCVGPMPTLALRRAQILARIVQPRLTRARQSRAAIIALAASLGYTIAIEEPQPFTCDSSCDDAIMNEPWAFAWYVHAPAQTIFEFTCDSTCDEPLRYWNNQILECLIRRRAPPDTIVIFAYGD